MAGVLQKMLARLRGGEALDARERSRRDRRLAMNGTLDQCRALLHELDLDVDTLGILARRGAQDIVEGVVRHPAFTTELGQWLLTRPTTTPAVRALILAQSPDHERRTAEPPEGFGRDGRFVPDAPPASPAPLAPFLTPNEPPRDKMDGDLRPATQATPPADAEVVWPSPVSRPESSKPEPDPAAVRAPSQEVQDDEPPLEADEFDVLVTMVEMLAEDSESPAEGATHHRENQEHRDDRVDRLLMELFGLEAAGETFDRLAYRLSSSTPWGKLRGSLEELMDHGFDPEVIALAFHIRADWLDRFGADNLQTHMSWRTAARFVTCFDPGTTVDEMQARLEAIVEHWLARGGGEFRTLAHFVAHCIDDYATARERGGQVPLDVLYP